MNCLTRRANGVYVARLVVPSRLRNAVGKRELIASTGSRVLVVATVIAAERVASWRRFLYELDLRSGRMNVLQLITGSPSLVSGRTLPINAAAALSGIDERELLQRASEGELQLFVRAGGLDGFELPLDTMEIYRELAGDTVIVPSPAQMPDVAVETRFSGLLRVRAPAQMADMLLGGEKHACVLFDLPDAPGHCFAPRVPFAVRTDLLEVSAADVERFRVALVSSVTPEQHEAAHREAATTRPLLSTKGASRFDVATVAYIADITGRTRMEQQKRTTQACELFADLMSNPVVAQVDRDMLRLYRDNFLPRVPRNEHRIRQQHKTGSVSASIEAIDGIDWPRLSEGECARRMTTLSKMFQWLTDEGWIDKNPALGLKAHKATGKAKTAPKASEATSRFDHDDLQLIFSREWFTDGKGKSTELGSYREYRPHYYWLPLMGLFTGARINELAQLSISDVRQSPKGVWFLDVNDDDEDSVASPLTPRKRLKNSNSRRTIPLHLRLIELGILSWRDRLAAAGHTKLFPELRVDQHKGASKDAVRWFSRFLKSLGWARDRRKTFHSFRHTFISHCTNDLRLPEMLVAQLSGHARGSSVLMKTYRKDELPDALMEAMDRVHFDLPAIAKFDCDAGMLSIKNSIAGKERRAKEKSTTAAA